MVGVCGQNAIFPHHRSRFNASGLPAGGVEGKVGGLGVTEDRRRLSTSGLFSGSGTKDGRLISSKIFSMPSLHQGFSRIPSQVIRVFSSGLSISRMRARQSIENG